MRPSIIRLRDLVTVLTIGGVRLSGVAVGGFLVAAPLFGTVPLGRRRCRGDVLHLSLHEWIQLSAMLNGFILILLQVVLRRIAPGSFVLFRPLPPRLPVFVFHAFD